MKKTDYIIILFAVIFGLFVYLSDIIVHFFFFYEGTFLQLLISEVPKHEMYIRTSFFVVLIIFGYILSRYIRKSREAELLLQNIFDNILPICITNKNYEIVKANNAYWATWKKPEKGPLKCYDHRPGKACHTDNCAMTQVFQGKKKFTCESEKKHNGEDHHFLVTAKPFLDRNKEIIGTIESFQDITERKRLENEIKQLVTELQESFKKVKLLSGIIPICSSCKKVRDDKGYWSQVESYVRDHSEADFSHSVCPQCAKKLYPDFDISNMMES